MRGYHIRIALAPPKSAPGSSTTTSTSYKQQSPASSATGTQPFVPSSLFQPLPAHGSRFSARRNTLSVYKPPSDEEKAQEDSSDRRDYRFGPIRVDWVDFSRMDPPGSSFIKVSSGKEREKAAQRRGKPLSLKACATRSAAITHRSSSLEIPPDVPCPTRR